MVGGCEFLLFTDEVDDDDDDDNISGRPREKLVLKTLLLSNKNESIDLGAVLINIDECTSLVSNVPGSNVGVENFSIFQQQIRLIIRKRRKGKKEKILLEFRCKKKFV